MVIYFILRSNVPASVMQSINECVPMENLGARGMKIIESIDNIL